MNAFHFYATTAIGWAVADTRADAIAKALRQSKGMFKPDDNGGTYVWSARVELPKTASYAIENYMPKDVPISDVQQGSFKMKGKVVLCLTRVDD